MKKKLASAIISIFLVLLLPLMSFAKTAISEGELDAVTAQEGVTLDFGTYANPSVTVTNFAPSLLSYGDSGGFGATYTSYGWVGMNGISIGAASNITLYNSMIVDVGSSGTVTKLNIVLPSVRVRPFTTNAGVKLDTANNLSSGNQLLGTLYNDQFELIINPLGNSSVTISNHSATNTQGIETTFNNFLLAIPAIAMDASWGDDNGYGTTYTAAGYFGVKDFVTSANMLIAFSGTANIDVGTSGARTILNVVLPSVTINSGLAEITAPLALGTVKDFSDNQKLLGTLNVRGFSTNITGSTQIYSH